ncbi:hypothetical protein S40285_03739 [Stachybotrys chlorohalonatus IBT 40285]|uniref:Zn(2)-C6 fungal-type domain-containing protein n=1 Tax=Stachybotrys chlorohalonatus (strain IBT 40285) TaxID=1283841 RepID=A0A084QJ03_STAC4|nr:hypothetical protein S40285_03739 [Stachybotrys chlorohalonata IBT 40285]
MPGVPSGRGCEACRKQKKKCDQAKPKCARCARLNIPCVDCGKQRYKFKESSLVHKQNQSPPQAAVATSSTSTSAPALVLLHRPSNQTDLSTLEYISLFQVDDLRYDPSCYGMFLRKIPSRMGRSETLDASAVAVSKSLRAYQRKNIDAEALSTYVRAIRILRGTLQDPVRANTADTLLSIYMVMICQGWLGQEIGPTRSHGEGIAAILNAAVEYELLPSLGFEIAYSMALTVIFESIANPRIPMEPWLTRVIDQYAKNGEVMRDCDETLRLVRIARIPKFVREPLKHIEEIKDTYKIVQSDFTSAYERLARVTEFCNNLGKGKRSITSLRILVGYQTAYGIFLIVGLLLGSIVLAYDSGNTVIQEELAKYRREAVSLAHVAMEHRPLGGSHACLALAVAWAMSDDVDEQTEIWLLVEDFMKDFPQESWQDRGLWLRRRIETIRLHQQNSPKDHLDVANDPVADSCVCTVM